MSNNKNLTKIILGVVGVLSGVGIGVAIYNATKKNNEMIECDYDEFEDVESVVEEN